ncbi:hypothetical protein U9M48_032458 [Paspalum notatum var. saurae]|uniref:Uncharacterized protein n=1 Tax=Paspalum notatum var. saurae TaxID=547442 RepID=A0AAQ3X5F9_PASNO
MVSFDRPGYALDILELADNLQLAPSSTPLASPWAPRWLNYMAILGPRGQLLVVRLAAERLLGCLVPAAPAGSVGGQGRTRTSPAVANLKLFSASSSAVAYNPALLSEEDKLINPKSGNWGSTTVPECLHWDMMVGFGEWSWSPLQLAENQFADGQGKVHLWHGAEDHAASAVYHELPKSGHLFRIADGMPDVLVKSLLLGVVEPYHQEGLR